MFVSERVCIVEVKSHLDHSKQTLIGGGVGGDGEAPCGVTGNDAVNSTPGLSVRLVFIRHSQVSNNHIHPVLMNLAEELIGMDREINLLTLCRIFHISVPK